MRIRSGLLIGFLGYALWAPLAFADGLAESKVKAAFLHNFMTLTEWPAETGKTLTLCSYGVDPFGENLEKLQNKLIAGRSVTLRRINSVDNLDNCQVVFISAAVIGNLPRVLDKITDRAVLTIADSAGAARQGVALNMAADQGKVSIEINLSAARRQGLNLSYKLIQVATEVIK